MNVLLDANVLLDILLKRMPWAAEGAVLWDAHDQRRITISIAAFTVPTVYYIVRRQTDIPTAQLAVQRCLQTLHIAAVDRTVLLTAEAMPGNDFEDNLQIASAFHAGLDAIVTRDATGFSNSPLTVLSPAELVAQLGASAAP